MNTTMAELNNESGHTPRERILSAAGQLLEQSDDGSLSTRAVQELAQVSAPTLYHHFRDKTGLIDAVIDDAFRRYLAVKKVTLQGEDPISALRAGWSMHVEFGTSQPVLYGLMYAVQHDRTDSATITLARDELRASLETLERMKVLIVPLDEAAAILEAAATGATLHAIRYRMPSSDPFIRHLRDAVITRLTGIGLGDPPPEYPDIAKRLLSTLPTASIPGLTTEEVAILKIWLTRLTPSTPNDAH
jgi:AcrR family transcriptional regulator